jgi:hypothetical protein
MPWEPVLEGDLAASAARAVHGIAGALAARPELATPADRTVFWAYVSGALDGDAAAAAAYDAATDELIAELERGAAHPALYGGLAGIGWTLGHVMEGGADEVLQIVDRSLGSLLETERWRGPHDLTQGLVGMGVYFLERLASAEAPVARDGLARIVDHLAALAIESDAGTTWHTGPDILPPFVRASWPDGYYDAGVAHGVPGTIALLSRAAAQGDAPPQARALRDGAVRWLAAQRQSPAPNGRFPSRIWSDAAGVPAPRDRARAAWCYGDPGIAAALWTAAPELARETALDAARRDAATCGVADAGLCHGAAGLAHLFNRFYQATGDAVFADAARAWFGRALDLRRDDGPGIGGFAAWYVTAPGEPPAFHPIANFLEGSIGIGLALLAAITPATAPSWDRLLLCDVPTRSD